MLRLREDKEGGRVARVGGNVLIVPSISQYSPVICQSKRCIELHEGEAES
jgi:hypothetical protein